MSEEITLRKYEEWRGQGLKTCTVVNVHAEGSTYTKPGAFLIMNERGEFHGLISGGCLENELVTTALACLREEKALLKTYDLLTDDDDFWGSGSGCRGLISAFFIPSTIQDYLPEFLISAKEPFLTLNLKSSSDLVSVGRAYDGIKEVSAVIREKQASLINSLQQGRGMSLRDGDDEFFILRRRYPLRILILGGGPDAIPFLEISGACGWNATLVDHRRGYVTGEQFSAAGQAVFLPEPDSVQLKQYLNVDAVIIKSHRYDIDEAYLGAVAESDIPYVGLLGPEHRREKLLSGQKDLRDKLAGRLFSPAGINMKSYDPASIAVSIIAEIMVRFNGAHEERPSCLLRR